MRELADALRALADVVEQLDIPDRAQRSAPPPDLLLTPAQVAAEFKGGKDARWVLESRLRYGWPCVKVGRTIRFAPEQVEEIRRRHTVQGGTSNPALDGQTERSKRAS